MCKMTEYNHKVTLVNFLHRRYFFFFLCVVLPSNPRNITVPLVNQSSAVIHWLSPVITGGQVFYEVECKRTCELNGKDCAEETCDDNAVFVFKDKIYSTKIMIPETTRALFAYVNYTCKIIAKNRVSEMAKRKHKIEASGATISFRTKGSGKSWWHTPECHDTSATYYSQSLAGSDRRWLDAESQDKGQSSYLCFSYIINK